MDWGRGWGLIQNFFELYPIRLTYFVLVLELYLACFIISRGSDFKDNPKSDPDLDRFVNLFKFTADILESKHTNFLLQ